MSAADPFDLERFVRAQAPVIGTVLDELRAGRKRTHWMWFVFPQLHGLGHSSTALFYGISSLAEARAYLDHPELGPTLDRCTSTVLALEGRSLETIFGSPDDMKFRSSMTLFTRASDVLDSPFLRALERYCDGQPDPATTSLLGARRD